MDSDLFESKIEMDEQINEDETMTSEANVNLDDSSKPQTVDQIKDDSKSEFVDLNQDQDDSKLTSDSISTCQDTVDLSINESDSNDSSCRTRMLPVRSLQSGDGDDNYSNLSDANSVEYMTTLNTSGQNSAEEIAKHELRKLSLDQNGTFMVDFDPEKSNREMRKMNRRIHSKDSKRNQLYDEKGLLLETSIDLCDCLDKECPGCHFPCQRCGSNKCGPDCRCHRKYTVDFIEVEGTETIYNFPC